MPTGVYPRKPITARFWAKVNRHGPVSEYAPYLGQCWLWTGKKAGNGYGQLWCDGGRIYAHRWAYVQKHGPIPISEDGSTLQVCHHCDTPSCVRADHLFVGTQADNLADMEAKGRARRWNVGMTHCQRGHAFDEANTYHQPSGKRACRACRRVRSLAWYYRNKAVP